MTELLHNKLIKLISEDKIESALDLLEENGQIDNNLVLIKARFKELRRLDQFQIIDHQILIQKTAALRSQLLFYVNELLQTSIKSDYAHSIEAARLLKDSGKYADAILEFERIIAKKFDEEIANELGLIQIDIGDFDAALSTYRRILEKKPQFYKALNNLGLAYFRLKDYNEACYYYNQAYQRSSKVICLKNLVNALSELKDHASIIQIVSEHISKHNDVDDIPDLYFLRAKVHMRNEDQNLEAAFSDINQAIQLNPQIASYYITKADIYFKYGQEDEAVKEVERAIYFDSDPYYKRYHAALLLDLKRFHNAIESTSQALLMHPNESGLYNLRGLAYLYINDLENARNDFEHFLTLTPNENNYEVYKQLSNIYYDMGHIGLSESYSKKAEACRDS